MKLALDHWHIEPSSKCTLKCPRCPRSEVPESLLYKELTLNFFKNQIGADIIKNIKKITFCGNDGDPIYCNDLLDIIQWIKDINPSIHIVIITNGSYKQKYWWERLAKILDESDEINWSLDGWDQESNEQYRVNSNWDSIQLGIDTFFNNNNSTYRVWSAIGFKFNECYLNHMHELARLKKFDLFQLTKSTKFGSKYPDSYGEKDPLEPNYSLIPKGHRFERQLYPLSEKTRYSNTLKPLFQQRANELAKTNYSGICLIGNKGVFLNARGEFYPCCWVANRYEHNAEWQNKFNLYERTFTKIINDNFWTNEFLSFKWQECQTKCTPANLKNKDHVTEW